MTIQRSHHGTDDEIVLSTKELVAVMRDVLDGALRLTARLAAYDEEWDAIERVRDFIDDWLAGDDASVAIGDLVLVLSILQSTIDDHGGDAAELAAPLEAIVERTHPSPVIRVPGDASTETPTVVCRRRLARHRNAAIAFGPTVLHRAA